MKVLFPLALMTLFFLGCNKIPSGYQKYQTFDEYQLRGITSDSYIHKPFIAVKSTGDTIDLIVYRRLFFDEIKLRYINKFNYWYSSFVYIPRKCSDCRQDTTPRYFEKFIFHDTIMTYSYYFNKCVGKSLEQLQFSTNNEVVVLKSKAYHINESTKFQDLKHYVVNYKTLFHLENPGDEQHYLYRYNRYRIYATCDTLYYFSTFNSKYAKKGECIDKRSLNSLGKFGIDLFLMYNEDI